MLCLEIRYHPITTTTAPILVLFESVPKMLCYSKSISYIYTKMHIDIYIRHLWKGTMVNFMALNATFNNIVVKSWRSVLLVEKTGVSTENHRPAANHWQIYSIMLYQVHLAWVGFDLTTLVVISTDCTGSCKSN
jgi:hypothetical protein